MNHQLRVPTPEPFSFIEFQFEGTPEEAIDEYRRLTAAVKDNKEMPVKQFNEILDLMIAREPIQMDPGELETMSSAQRYVFDQVRKSIGRIKYKNN